MLFHVDLDAFGREEDLKCRVTAQDLRNSKNLPYLSEMFRSYAKYLSFAEASCDLWFNKNLKLRSKIDINFFKFVNSNISNINFVPLSLFLSVVVPTTRV